MAIADPAKRVVALSFITLNLLEKPFSFALVTQYLKPHMPPVQFMTRPLSQAVGTLEIGQQTPSSKLSPVISLLLSSPQLRQQDQKWTETSEANHVILESEKVKTLQEDSTSYSSQVKKQTLEQDPLYAPPQPYQHSLVVVMTVWALMVARTQARVKAAFIILIIITS